MYSDKPRQEEEEQSRTQHEELRRQGRQRQVQLEIVRSAQPVQGAVQVAGEGEELLPATASCAAQDLQTFRYVETRVFNRSYFGY